MINMTLNQAAMLMHGSLENAEKETRFEGVSTDSRTVHKGSLFAPIVGARVDGHDFAEDVFEKGAAAMLWQKDHLPVPKGLPVIVVEDVITALGDLARGWLEEIDPYTIGITGSNGKTSTKDFVASLFSQKYKTWKTQGNHNNEIGLPLTIFEADEDTQVLILEMGMENTGEIAYLCSIAPLNLAIITSIGSAHLENLGSKLNIARAKCEILSSLKPFGTFIYNNDGIEIQMALKEVNMEPGWTVIPYGNDTEYQPQDLHHTRHGLSFSLPALCRESFHIPSASDVQAYNATAALLAARAGHVPEKDWQKGLEEVHLTPMRGDLHPLKNSVILDDTYKSNPEAARSAITTLMEIPAAVHIAVLGDMLDLGEEEQAIHAGIGDFARKSGVDLLYSWGPLSRHTAEAFGENGRHFEEKADLVEALMPYAEKDAAILVKGSRAMKMDEVVKACLERNTMEKIRLGVIFGGQSSEYSVSLHSAASFLRSIHKENYDITMIGISLDGGFYRYSGSIDDLEHDHWQNDAAPIAWVHKGIVDLKENEKIDLDCVFPILHGKNGEDGSIQGMMNILDLPVVGCDVLGSAICMDKEVMHRLIEQAGLPAADYVCLYQSEPIPSFKEVKTRIDLPWVIKPCNAGSSYGVHFVENEEQYEEAVKDAFQYDGRGKILVEEAIDGFEIGCAVMGDDDLKTGEIDEIEMAGKVFDFEGKYAMKDSEIHCPARISPEKSMEAKELAKKVYKALCCRDMARVDMFVANDGRIVLNEVNTIPGLTDTSRYPSMMKAAGLDFADLIDQLVELAMEKVQSL